MAISRPNKSKICYKPQKSCHTDYPCLWWSSITGFVHPKLIDWLDTDWLIGYGKFSPFTVRIELRWVLNNQRLCPIDLSFLYKQNWTNQKPVLQQQFSSWSTSGWTVNRTCLRIWIWIDGLSFKRMLLKKDLIYATTHSNDVSLGFGINSSFLL